MSQSAKAIVWIDGHPQPAGDVAPISKATMNSLLGSALALEYKPTNDDRDRGVAEDYVGLSNAEVAMIKLAKLAAFGDFDATKEIMDRTMGKAKQEIANTTVSFTYQDYLQALVEQDKINAIDVVETKQLVTYAEVVEEDFY